MVQWCNGAMVQWCNGAMVQWCNGTMVQWYNGAMVQWCNGAMVQWCNGAMVQWCNGKFHFFNFINLVDTVYGYQDFSRTREQHRKNIYDWVLDSAKYLNVCRKKNLVKLKGRSFRGIRAVCHPKILFRKKRLHGLISIKTFDSRDSLAPNLTVADLAFEFSWSEMGQSSELKATVQEKQSRKRPKRGHLGFQEQSKWVS